MKTLAPKRRGLRRVSSLSFFLCVVAVASLLTRAQGTAVRVETFSLRPGGEVTVENPRGETRVESWDYQTVRVVAEKRASAAGSIEPRELVLMGAQNSIIVQCKPGVGQIDLTVYVPVGARLQVTGGAWPVDIGGSLGSAIIETTSGNIAYHLPSNDDARIAMRSTQGSVRSVMPLTAVERSGTRSLRGQIGTGEAQLILNSQTGSVTLASAPNLTVAAKAAKKEAGAHAIGTQSPPAATASESGVDNENVRESSPSVTLDDAGTTQARSTSQTVQSNGSVVFGGSDRSNDSSSTSKTGPFVRPRSERTTGSGSSGMKVRIIPSTLPQSGSSSQGGSGSDVGQSADAGDASQHDQSSTNGSSRTSGASGVGSGSANTNSSANGSVTLGGSDRADNGASDTKIGPLERNRQTRKTSGGDSGVRVRIIPANAPPGPSHNSGLVFDNRDTNTVQGGSSPNNTSQNGSSRQAQSDAYTQPTGNTRRASPASRVGFDQEEAASADSRSNAPPVLRRNDDGAPSAAGNGETEKARPSDEEAVVLKAALVNLNVSVTNRAGVALANLRKEDFDVAENGEAQKIEFFQSTNAPFNLVLLLDLSGSIKDKLEVVKSAALRFIDVLGPQDKVAVVTFTDEIRVVSQLTDDRVELKRRIKSIDQSRGGTAFYEALWFSLMDTLRGTRGQRNAVVVMTDGVDSSLDRYNPMQTRVSFNQLARRLEEADVIVFPIYLDTEYEEVFERGNSSSEAYAIARDQLERIAEVSGGQMFKAEKVGDLAGVYKQVAAAIRTVYSVGYYPTNAEKDGTFRRVRVLVNRPDAAVRARKGYYAK
jgi:VWFA-related protein